MSDNPLETSDKDYDDEFGTQSSGNVSGSYLSASDSPEGTKLENTTAREDEELLVYTKGKPRRQVIKAKIIHD